MLRVEGLQVANGETPAVRGVDLEVRAGEAVAVIGPNGAGKSTLLRAISGMQPAAAGVIEFDGRCVVDEPAHRTARRGLVYVPAERWLFTDMTVADNLRMGAYPRRVREPALADVLELFPRLRERLRQRAGTLSGGEQQMLAIGRALMASPRLMVLDEPTGGLAPLVADEVHAALDLVRRTTSMTVLIAEQHVARALDLVDRAYVMEAGRIRLSGAVADLRADEAVRRAYLGGR